MEISPFVKYKTQEIIDNFYDGRNIYAKEILDSYFNLLVLIDEDNDKLFLIQSLLERTDTFYSQHILTCKSKTCNVTLSRDEIDFNLKKDLKKLNIFFPNDSFSHDEKEFVNNIVDEIILDLQNQFKDQSEKLEKIISELEELKHLHIIGKKNWKQQLVGKLTEMTVSGIISETVSKPLIENSISHFFPFIKQLF